MSRDGRKRYFKKQRQTARAMNATIVNPDTGMGGIQDRSSFGDKPLLHHVTNPFVYGDDPLRAAQWAWVLYAGDWMCQKLVDLPVFDTFREGWNWKYKGNDTHVDERLQEAADCLDVLDVFQKAKRMERVFGGAVIVIGTKEKESGQNERPLNVADVGKGDLLFLNHISRNFITKVEWQQDPTKPGYGRPEHYLVRGEKMHCSRLIIFDGNPISPYPGRDFASAIANWDGFGLSVYAPMWDSLMRAMEVQQGVSHLVNMSSIWAIINKGLRDQRASRFGKRQVAELEQAISEMSMYRALHLNGQDVDIKQLSASFGSTPEILMSMLQIVCAGADVPAARFLGTSPSGLNTDGDSWKESYYTSIEVKRKLQIERAFKQRILPLLCNSTFGPGVIDPADIDTEWPELRSISETEKAQIRTLDVNNTINALNAGILSDVEAQRELVAKKVFSITPSEKDLAEREEEQKRFAELGLAGDGALEADDPRMSPAGASIDSGIPRMPSATKAAGGGLPRMPSAMNAGDWDELKHPRADDGKFGKGASVGESNEKGESKMQNELLKECMKAMDGDIQSRFYQAIQEFAASRAKHKATSPEEKQKKIDSIKIDFASDNILPNLNPEDLAALGKEDKPVLLKKGVVDRNFERHPDIMQEEYGSLIGQALYNSDTIIPSNKPDKPNYYNFIKFLASSNSVVLIELSPGKEKHEIVHIVKMNNKGVKRLKK